MKIDCRKPRFPLANPRAWIILLASIQCLAPDCPSYLFAAAGVLTPSQRGVAIESFVPPAVGTNTAGQRTKLSASSKATTLHPFKGTMPSNLVELGTLVVD